MNASSTGQQTASEFSIFETAYDKEILQENLRYDLEGQGIHYLLLEPFYYSVIFLACTWRTP